MEGEKPLAHLQHLKRDQPRRMFSQRVGSKLWNLSSRLVEKKLKKRVPGPFLTHRNELVVLDEESSGAFEVLYIGKRLFVEYSSVIFEPLESPHLSLIKYQVNCDALSDIHPLIREAVMLNQIAHLDISMKNLYLSGAVNYAPPVSLKSPMLRSDSDLNACFRDARSSVRFMVMERAQYSLRDLKERISLDRALKLTIELLSVIERLHGEADIVHGDIHPGNVVIDNTSGKIKLIDFGRAFFNSDFLHAPEFERRSLEQTHILFTHFNLLGSRSGFRDDLFNALHVLAYLAVGGDAFTEFLLKLSPEDLLEFKQTQYYFEIPGVYNPVFDDDDDQEALDIMSQEQKELVFEYLNSAMQVARDQPSVTERARIPEAIHFLSLALSLVTPPQVEEEVLFSCLSSTSSTCSNCIVS